jgi:uncharacterized repeat protein (TIGR01451 family)
MSRHAKPLDHRWIRGGIDAIALGLALLAQSGAAGAQEPSPADSPSAPTTPIAPAPAQTAVEGRPAVPDLTPGRPIEPPATSAATAPPAAASAPGAVVAPEGHGLPVGAVLDPSTQVVRFQGPAGLSVEVLAPQPLPASVGDGGGILTAGLQRGVGYRLRLANISERPGAELFPVIEVVGHLHRPAEIDPGKYPIRVVFTDQDLWDAVDHGRMVTKVIYLEDPDQALPLKLKKDEIPLVSISPTEDPVKVAAALGRVIAIVRIGGRRPTVEEIQAGATGDVGLDALAAVPSNGRCPFANGDGSPCQAPCGPACPPLQPAARPWLPRDEYLCDGGDRGARAGSDAQGKMYGVEPRDAVVRFDVGLDRYPNPKVLPTNRVCIYAPRFAEVRVTNGTSEAVEIHSVSLNETSVKANQAEKLDRVRKFVLNQAPEQARERRRAQGMKGKVAAGEGSDVRGAMGYGNIQQVRTDSQEQAAVTARQRDKPALIKEKVRLIGIKTAEAPVVSALTQGAGQTIMSWQPNEMTGVETPPNRPGLAVIKRVSVNEAEPGDTVTYVITYRNMGNTPIRSVSIVDSLLPRLEYVAGSAKGPKGSTFSSAENRAGAMELKWDLPGAIPPGASGYVSFDAVVR